MLPKAHRLKPRQRLQCQGGELLESLPDYRIEVSHPEPGEAEDVLAEFEEELAKARAELPPHAAEPDMERYEPSVAGEVPDVREVEPPPPAAEEPVASGQPKAPDPDDAILLKDLAGACSARAEEDAHPQG